MVSDEALKKLQEQIAAWPIAHRFTVQRLIESYLRDRQELRAYQSTGLTPEEVLPKEKADEIALKLMRLADLESICSYTRLRDLAEADKDGRVVVLPFQSGEHVFALLDDQKRVRECEVKHAVLDGWRKIFYIAPVGAPGDAYSAPFGAFGKTVFLTREEAEKALEAREDV